MLYILSYSWYEEYKPIILEGPEVENWKEYCDSLLDEAKELALKNADGWCGWRDIVYALSEILCKKGYTILKPEESGYWGSNIIDNEIDCEGYQLKEVVEHNIKFRNELYDKR